MEKNGFIKGYHAELNADQLHAGLLVFVQVSLDRTTPDIFARFTEALTPLDQVQECHMVAMVAGGFDYLLKLRFSDMAAYRQFFWKRTYRPARHYADAHLFCDGRSEADSRNSATAGC